jgi:hypothetical protein
MPVRQPTSQGNIEGTPARAPESTGGHSSSGDSFFLRDFRARGFPLFTAVPASLLDGKEGVDGSSPSEGFNESAGTPRNKRGARSRNCPRMYEMEPNWNRFAAMPMRAVSLRRCAVYVLAARAANGPASR